MAKCILSPQSLNRGHTPKTLCHQPSIIYRDLWKNMVGRDMSQMLCHFDHLADTTFSCVGDMTKDMSPTCRQHDTPCLQMKAREDTTQYDIPC